MILIINWDFILKILGYISGPLVGAIIGLITNYIAVRMLFHPYYPIKIFGIRLPFTPGIVPKRKSHIAKAIGSAVGDNLFTKDDMKGLLCTQSVENKLVSTISDTILSSAKKTPSELISTLSSQDVSENAQNKISVALSKKVVDVSLKMDIADILATKGKEIITERKSSMGLLGVFLTDGVIDPIIEKMKEEINLFLENGAEEKLLPAISEQVGDVFENPISSTADLSIIDKEKLDNKIKEFYEKAIDKAICCISDELDIAAIVEAKINEMDIRELEELCLSVMKKELGAVVRLGAVIGFVIGLINSFI